MNENPLDNLSEDPDSDWFGDRARTAPPSSGGSGRLNPERLPGVSWKWAIGIACLILGVLFSLLFKTYKREGIVSTLYGSRQDLAMMVKYLQTERDKLQTEIENSRKVISDYEDTASKGKDETATIKKQLNVSRQEAGFTHVRGPGIEIRLNDSRLRPKEGDDPNYYIVHDIDLLALTNELWASGAEAISINDQRLVMTTPIRCVGPTITVNAVHLSPPYFVKAIGPQDELEKGLTYTGGFMDSMTANLSRGVEVKIYRKEDLVLAPFKGSLSNRYAKTYVPGQKEEK